MELSVIIVNYNVQYFLEQALLSVRKAAARVPDVHGRPAVEVFVVDNHSVDNSVDMVQEKFPEVKLIANKQNTGFAVANNQAIRASTGKYVLLLNPDTVVREDTFVSCLAFMDAHPEAGGLGVKMIDGSGKFLPESKRGFPSPFVAFAKTFGLSRLFPRSRIFNRYHLGYLDEHETHEVEVLAGAFMLLRKSVLDQTGLLDEAFFMYGEDIDLSYRIVQAGYKNYYFAGTTIIHYKGESTRKGSLNYVRTFYQAMIIFARKHFQGSQARLFIAMIYGAIYFRAALTLLGSLFSRTYLLLLDALILFAGLYVLKNFWSTYYYHDPDYFKPLLMYFNVPFYIATWLGAVFFTGGYDEPFNLRRLIRGLLLGTLVLAAIYGFLPLALRPSRAIIVLGVAWALVATTGLRTAIHFFRTGNFGVGRSRPDNLVIVGSEAESQRVRNLLAQAQVQKNYIGVVSPSTTGDTRTYLSDISRLDEVTQIYKVDEIIFCSRDVSSEHIMQWMSRLGPSIDYKIVPRESASIIGSSSKDSAGELYTIEIRYQIATRMARRNKRVLDLALAFLFLAGSPLLLLYVRNRAGLLLNGLQVMAGRKSWVGYSEGIQPILPVIRPGVLSPLHSLKGRQLNEPTVQRLNFLYAKDYDVWRDLEVIWKGLKELGRRTDPR